MDPNTIEQIRNAIQARTYPQFARLLRALGMSTYDFSSDVEPSARLERFEQEMLSHVPPVTWEAVLEKVQRPAAAEPPTGKVQKKTTVSSPSSGLEPIRILQLSDLHFTTDKNAKTVCLSLQNHLREAAGKIHYLVVSGDFTDKGGLPGMKRATKFVQLLRKELGRPKLILVPGNHDVVDPPTSTSYTKTTKSAVKGKPADSWSKEGSVYWLRNDRTYARKRFKPFSDHVHEPLLGGPYPVEPDKQWSCISSWADRLQFICLNSTWKIDRFYRKRSDIHHDALLLALEKAEDEKKAAIKKGLIAADAKILRIGVWHHAVNGPYQMENTDFLNHLRQNDVRVGLHGDVHTAVRTKIESHGRRLPLHIVGAGAFGANVEDRPETVPRLFNLLELRRDLTGLKVCTSSQETPRDTWEPHPFWVRGDGKKAQASYDIRL